MHALNLSFAMPLSQNVFLLLSGLILGVACDDQDRPKAPDARESADDLASADSQRGDLGMIPAPGLEDEALFPLLGDSYSRIDPAKDGWETEAFSESARRQLQRLETLFETGAPDVQGHVVAWHANEAGFGLSPRLGDAFFAEKPLAIFVFHPKFRVLSCLKTKLA